LAAILSILLTVQDISVSKHTQLKYKITSILHSELIQDFGGDINDFRVSMTNAMSTYINPWTNPVATQPQLTDIGSKTFINTIVQ
jgi:hypothetical protein